MLVPASAFAHVGPGVEPSFTVIHEAVAGELRTSFLLPRELFIRLFGGTRPEDARRGEVLRRLGAGAPIRADDRPLEPELLSAWFVAPREPVEAGASITSNGTGATVTPTRADANDDRLERSAGPWSFVQVRLTRRLPARFERLSFGFELPETYLEHADAPELRRELPEHVFPLVAAERRHLLRFTPEEDVSVVHRYELVDEAPVPAPAAPPRLTAGALVPLAALLGLAVLLALRRRVAPGARALWATAVLGLSVVLAVSLDRGLLRPRQAMPEDAARGLFEPLLDGLYAAFARPSEAEIYDALAQVVDGPLLERVYREVHRSLIRREHAGALTSVRHVELVEIEAESERWGRAEHHVRARWRVEGRIEHFGHVHERVLAYRGRFRVAPGADGRLRIVEAELEPPEEPVGPP